MMIAKGEVTLVAGRAVVPVQRLPAAAVVVLSRKSMGGITDDLPWTISPGESFTIQSVNILDTSTVRWSVFV